MAQMDPAVLGAALKAVQDAATRADTFWLNIAETIIDHFSQHGLVTGDLSAYQGSAANRFKQCWSAQRAGMLNVAQFSDPLALTSYGGGLVKVVLTGNASMWTLVNGLPDERCTILFVQDGTGNRKIGTKPANVKLTNNGALTLTTNANAVDLLSLVCDGAGTWYETGRALKLA